MTDEEFDEKVKESIKRNLGITVTSKEEYTGGLDGSGQLYKTVSRIEIDWDGEPIAEAWLD